MLNLTANKTAEPNLEILDLTSQNQTVISLVEIPTTDRLLDQNPIHIETQIDERDQLIEYTNEENDVYLSESTLWIYPANNSQPLRSPNDKPFLLRTIYAELGQLNSLMQAMNWHVSCKKELMRWIRKHNLSDDIAIARQGIIDESEELIKQAVRNGDIDSAKFVLKTAGKGRGWNEKDINQEKGDVYAFISLGKENEVDLSKLSNQELTRYLEDKLKGNE